MNPLFGLLTLLLTTQPVDIENIRFYESRDECIQTYQAQSFDKKVISAIHSCGAYSAYIARRVRHLFCRPAYSEYRTIPSNSSKRRLAVCLHGVDCNHAQFSSVVFSLESDHPEEIQNIDIFTPDIPNRGNDDLISMAQGIVESIDSWIGDRENLEVVLVGISNGSRIARMVETQLLQKPEKIKKLRFISVVGAYNGSSMASVARKFGLLSRPFISSTIVKEMAPNSESIISLQKASERAQKETALGDREYFFIASPPGLDWLVPDLSSTLPKIDHTAHYGIVPGNGHHSIVKATAKAIADLICIP